MVNKAKEKYLSLILDALKLNKDMFTREKINDIIDAGEDAGVLDSDFDCSDFCINTLMFDLRKLDKAVWSDMLNYAWGTEVFYDLKALSPFAGMAFVRLTNCSGSLKLEGEIAKRLMSEVERRGLMSDKMRSTYAIFLPLHLSQAEIKEVGNG